MRSSHRNLGLVLQTCCKAPVPLPKLFPGNADLEIADSWWLIHTAEENEAYTEILHDLDRRSKELTPAEMDLAELLTLLIENFEETNYLLPRSKPLDVLRFLIDQHNLRQKDLVYLVSVFGTPSIVSEVLSGKREMNKDHIKRLGARFHVSPELFF